MLYSVQWLTSFSRNNMGLSWARAFSKWSRLLGRVQFFRFCLVLINVVSLITCNESSEYSDHFLIFYFVGFTVLDIIVILVYYCQDVQLVHKTIHGNPFHNYNDVLNALLSLFTRFNWDILTLATNLCATKGSTALTNQVLAMFFIPLILVIFGIICLIWNAMVQRRQRYYTYNGEGKFDHIGQLLWYSLFLTLLLTYQGHVLETTSLLKCVPYENGTVWFLDGNISCFQNWQYIVGIYLGLWLAPFSVILIFGPAGLHGSYLSMIQFILFCIFPLPMLIFLVFKTIVRKLQGGLTTVKLEFSVDSSIITNFLRNSDRDLPYSLEKLCCHGVIMMFRFAMVIMYTYNEDVIKGIVGILVVVFAKLCYTIVALPYSSAG